MLLRKPEQPTILLQDGWLVFFFVLATMYVWFNERTIFVRERKECPSCHKTEKHRFFYFFCGSILLSAPYLWLRSTYPWFAAEQQKNNWQGGPPVYSHTRHWSPRCKGKMTSPYVLSSNSLELTISGFQITLPPPTGVRIGNNIIYWCESLEYLGQPRVRFGDHLVKMFFFRINEFVSLSMDIYSFR